MAMIESRARATSDPEARRHVLERIARRSVEYVLFWFTDVEGHLKSFAITPAEMEGALDDGMGFDGSSITGFNAIEESDMVAIPDPTTFQIMPSRRRRDEGRPPDLRRRPARRAAVRGRPAVRAPPRARADGVHGIRHVQRRPRARVLPVRGQQGHVDARRGRLLRDDGARRRDRGPQRHDPRAGGGRDPDRVPPPRGRAVAARDRHALRGRARHGRLHHDLPPDREGGRGEARRLRDVHAEAAVRRERLRDAHPHVALQATAATSSSPPTTSTTSPRPASSSSRASSGTRASCRPYSRSG